MTESQRRKLAIVFPELKDKLEQRDFNDSLANLFNNFIDNTTSFYAETNEVLKNAKDRQLNIKVEGGVVGIKGDSIVGPPGKDGYTPVKGMDYFDGKDGKTPTPQELLKLITPLIPESIPGLPGKDGRNGRDGNDGKNAPIITIEDIVKEVTKSLPENKPEKGKIDQRWHGGGLSRVSTDSTLTGNGTPSSPLSVISGGGVTVETPAGSLYNQSTGLGGITFTVTHIPKWIVGDGATFFENAGYTISSLTVTMTNPVTQYIRNIY